MKGFADSIEKLTELNDTFRQILYKGQNIQLVPIAIQPGDDIDADA